jgi:hypothetical protein
VKVIKTVLYALIPGHAAKVAQSKADSENFREGLKWLIGSRAFQEAGAREILPA